MVRVVYARLTCEPGERSWAEPLSWSVAVFSDGWSKEWLETQWRLEEKAHGHGHGVASLLDFLVTFGLHVRTEYDSQTLVFFFKRLFSFFEFLGENKTDSMQNDGFV